MKKLDKTSAMPLHQQLKNIIQEKIKQGQFKTGEEIPSTAELCACYQVSTITVRRTISDLIAEGLLRGTPGKGTFVTSGEKKKNNKLVGVIFTGGMSNPFLLEIFRGIENVLSGFGYHLIISISEGNAEKERQTLIEFRERGIDGIIMIPVSINRTSSANESLKELLAKNVPLVFIDQKITGFSVDYVASDNEKGSYMATQYLLKLGHRRIAFIFGQEVSSVRERLAGYRRALTEFNLPFDRSMIKSGHLELEAESCGYQNALELLLLKTPPTAIFACNDPLALGVYRTCHQLGLNIPEDLSLVGYDNLFFTASLIPPLTTIHQPIYEMGRKAGELLLRRITGENGNAEKIILENQLIERSSCAPPPKRVRSSKAKSPGKKAVMKKGGMS